MNSIENLIKLADILVTRQRRISLNYIQKVILHEALQSSKKTYDQIALEAGYSSSYIKNGVAPKLWNSLTEALQKKVSKTNCRFILEQTLQNPTQVMLPNLLEPIHPVSLESPEGVGSGEWEVGNEN
jgi:hypothetical protein